MTLIKIVYIESLFTHEKMYNIYNDQMSPSVSHIWLFYYSKFVITITLDVILNYYQ